MEKKAFLNNTSLEDLTLIKNDLKNLNDYYSKTFNQSQKNEQIKKEDSKQKEPITQETEEINQKNNSNNINNDDNNNMNKPKEIKDTR